MAVGLPLPDKISSALKKNNLVYNISVNIYLKYIKTLVKLKTWFKYNRNNYAPIKPFKLIWVSPINIESRSKKTRDIVDNFFFPEIIEGNWDKEKESMKEKTLFNSFKMRFTENKPWEETPSYKKRIKKIEKGESSSWYGTKEELLQVLEETDKLYNNISENGYKTQKEIKFGKDYTKKFNNYIDNDLGIFNEIIVNIGRDGEILFEEGYHRFYISKILELDEIPVRVLVRHKKWQEKRNMAVLNPEKLSDEEKQHPDIEYLLEN